jgi:hypothetical protein
MRRFKVILQDGGSVVVRADSFIHEYKIGPSIVRFLIGEVVVCEFVNAMGWGEATEVSGLEL